MKTTQTLFSDSVDSIKLIQLNSLEVKQNNCFEIDDAILKQIIGGRLPDSNETAIIVARANTDDSRAFTGAILNDENVKVNIGIADPGSSNNTVNQVNG